MLLIGILLIVGFSLISSLAVRADLDPGGSELLDGSTVTEVLNTDGDQRVDMKLSEPYEGASDVQFYYVTARAAEVVDAINAANPSDGFNDAVPRPSWFDGFLSLMLPLLLLGLLFWFLLSSAQAAAARSCSSESPRPSSSPRRARPSLSTMSPAADEAIERCRRSRTS